MSRRIPLVALVALVLLLAVSGAKAAPAAGVHLERLVPARTLAFASLEDVGKWEERFRSTALGKLLAEPEMKAFLTPISEDLAKMAEEAGKPKDPAAPPRGRGPFSLPPEVAELVKHLQGLSGQVSIALVDLDLETKDFSIAACLDFGDHLGDFTKFLTRMATSEGPNKPPMRVVQRGGRMVFEFGREGGPMTVSATPVGTAILASTDAAWLLATAEAGAKEVENSLGASEAFQASRTVAGGESVAVHVHANLPGILAKVKMGDEGRRIADALGVGAIRSVAYGIAMQGDGFLESFVVDAPKADRGIFPLLAMKPTSHAMLALAPATAFAYEESTIGLSTMLPKVRALVESISPKDARKIDEFVREANAKVGLDVEKDVLGGLSDEFAYWLGLPETGGLYPELAIALGVKDPKTFEGTFERVVTCIASLLSKEERITATTRTIDYRGQKLHLLELGSTRRDLVPFTPTWTILKDRLVITAVPHAMKEIVLRSQQGTEGSGGLAAQEDVRSLLRVAPQGHGGFSYLDLQAILALLYDTGVPLLQTVAKPNMLPVPVRLDWAQLPATRTIRPYLRSVGAFSTVDEKGLRVSVHGPMPMILPMIAVGAGAAMFAGRTAAMHQQRIAATRAVETPPGLDDDVRILQVAAAVEAWAAKTGKLPESIEAMGTVLPKDRFGRAFELRPKEGGAYEIRSAGADGVWGTDDDQVHEGRLEPKVR